MTLDNAPRYRNAYCLENAATSKITHDEGAGMAANLEVEAESASLKEADCVNALRRRNLDCRSQRERDGGTERKAPYDMKRVLQSSSVSCEKSLEAT